MIMFDVYFKVNAHAPTEYKMIKEQTLDEALYALNRFLDVQRAVAVVRRDVEDEDLAAQ